MNLVSRWTLSLGLLGCALVALGAGCRQMPSYTLVFGQKFTDREKLAERLILLIQEGGGKAKLGEPTKGSGHNAKKVRAGEADFGLGQSDLPADELNELKPIALFRGEYIQFYVSNAIWKQAQAKGGNALETLRDWKDSNGSWPRIGTGAVGSGSKGTSKDKGGLLSYFGLIPETNCLSGNQDYKQITDFCKGGYRDHDKLLDAYVFVSPPQSEVGRHLMGQNYHLVSFDDATLDPLVKQNSYWQKGTIPKGAVSQKQTEDVQTITIDLMLFVRENTSGEVSEKLLETLITSFKSQTPDQSQTCGYYTLVTDPQAPAFKRLDKKAAALLTNTPTPNTSMRYSLLDLLIGLVVVTLISCSLLWLRRRLTSAAIFTPERDGE